MVKSTGESGQRFEGVADLTTPAALSCAASAVCGVPVVAPLGVGFVIDELVGKTRQLCLGAGARPVEGRKELTHAACVDLGDVEVQLLVLQRPDARASLREYHRVDPRALRKEGRDDAEGEDVARAVKAPGQTQRSHRGLVSAGRLPPAVVFPGQRLR